MRWIMLLLASVCCLGAAPVRDNTYHAGNVIQPSENLANENNLYTYLQNGVDTYAAGSVTTAALANNSVTSAKIVDGTVTQADLAFTLVSGNSLPSGAVFFMFTGTCPAWTTDVSATYEGSFIRASATALTTGGAATHTHGPGNYVGAVHTHTQTADANQIDGGTAGTRAGSGLATGSGGGGAITGTSDTGSSLPPFVSAKLCKVT